VTSVIPPSEMHMSRWEWKKVLVPCSLKKYLVVQVKPGLVTVIAGPLVGGKSEFAMEIVCRLGMMQDFRTAICLTENQVCQRICILFLQSTCF